jgi:surfactin synthase thioesterase subunit
VDRLSPVRPPDSPDGTRARAAAGPAWRQWLAGQDLNPEAELRLLCLPYAGGGAAVFHRWRDLVPRGVQVCGVELPGRGHRMSELPYQRLTPLVRALAGALDPVLDRPFALFGHSMGGLIAFELARALRAAGKLQPVHLFVSAVATPGQPSSLPALRAAPDADVKKELRALNGTPRELLDDDELMALMLPVLRADFSVLETYEYRDEPPLPVPLTVFGGAADRVVPPSVLSGWRYQSSKGSRLQLFPGDHFFVHAATAEVVGAVTTALRSIG